MAAITNDEIEQDDAGLFAYDPMRWFGKRRPAMLTDPCHISRFSKAYAILKVRCRHGAGVRFVYLACAYILGKGVS
jgi:hypothetical protein